VFVENMNRISIVVDEIQYDVVRTSKMRFKEVRSMLS
jgi:hypothetical protein